MNAQADYRPETLQRLSFRRQFFLGDRFLEGFPEWTRIGVAGTHFISAHPDLEVYQASRDDKSVTLLGYVLDPDDPPAGNAAIVDRLLSRLETCEGFWRHTAGLGGRWVLVVHDGLDTVLFHDAGGQRSVYYGRDADSGLTICASRPLLVAERLGRARDADAVTYFETLESDDCDVYWTPGDTSLYEGVHSLLPNHLLDVRTGAARRYWPDADLPRLPFDDVLAESLRLLRGLMAGARLRFPLALSMTAGWDSRLMLALSRDISRELYAFTLVYPHSEQSRDVRVPSVLMRELGLAHEKIRYPHAVQPDFKAVYRRNAAAGRTTYCADAQALYEQYPAGRVCITGDVAEVVKCYYGLPDERTAAVSGPDLADLCGPGRHAFLVRAMERWRQSASSRNLPVLDLFCWEQFVGKKQALIRAEYDIVQESFAPLNCRALLVTMLSADEPHRRAPQYTLLRKSIEQLWPDTLRVPVNPRDERRLKQIVRRALDPMWAHVPGPLRKLGRRPAPR